MVQKDSLQRLGTLMRRGLILDDIKEMTDLLKDLGANRDHLIPCFVAREVLKGIARDWEGRPVDVEEAEFVEATLLPVLRKILERIEGGANVELQEATAELVVAGLALEERRKTTWTAGRH